MSTNPTPGKRKRRGRWYIYWRDGKTFELGIGDVSEEKAEQKRLQIEVALSMGTWPKWALKHKPVQRYRKKARPGSAPDDLLAAYRPTLEADVSDGWAKTVIGHLEKLRGHAGSLKEVSPSRAADWLRSLLDAGKTRATRNRALAAASRFYKWAVRLEYVANNPFANISQLKESRSAEIVYCTREERGKIIEASSGRPGTLAVWLSFFAGLRRSEAWRLQWRDVDLERGRIHVAPGKTGDPRLVPIAPDLDARLSTIEAHNRTGQVVDNGHCETWKAAARKIKRGLRAEKSLEHIPDDRIRWNAWRHTFGSLLAQEGVSLDKISSWMGNSPEICRRHYAQFVPRDRHDEEIDLL